MGAMKNYLIGVQDCDSCYGKGYLGFADSEGNYEFEWCECNPLELDLEGGAL